MPGRIGLVVLDYDQAPVTQRCLRSVAAGNRQPDEIVLVENGGPPVDLEAGRGVEQPERSNHRCDQNVSASAASNLGFNFLVRNGNVERFVLLDNDTIVPSNYFEAAVDLPLEPFEIAAALILGPESGELLYAGGTFDRHGRPRILEDWPNGKIGPREVDWAPTAALVLDRETWLRVVVGTLGTGSAGRMRSGVTVLPRRARSSRSSRACASCMVSQSSGGPFSPEAAAPVVTERQRVHVRDRRLARPAPLDRRRIWLASARVAGPLEAVGDGTRSRVGGGAVGGVATPDPWAHRLPGRVMRFLAQSAARTLPIGPLQGFRRVTS